MAREGRNHVCISCCTNIVQCRAWKDDGGGRSSGERAVGGLVGLHLEARRPPSPAKKTPRKRNRKKKKSFLLFSENVKEI